MSAAAAPVQAALASDDALALPRFYAALAALERRREGAHVRVLWFGDSHTAADFWPDTVRRALGRRFGIGGPGFARLGMKTYRHGALEIDSKGQWRREPQRPSSRSPHGDAIYGLGGIRAVAEVNGSEVRVRPKAEAVVGNVRYTPMFRLVGDARLLMTLGSKTTVVTKDLGLSATSSPIARLDLEAHGAESLSIRASGSVELFGVVVESETPGIVIDSLGIDGARAATPLAWEEKSFAAEVAARQPQLFVLAYGTNEVFDALAPQRYRDHYVELTTRLRRAVPAAECLIIGPPDAADPGYSSHPRVEEITVVQRRAARELGCAFFSAAHAMGGPGSFAEWLRHKPPLARSDRVHLTPDGYARLGKELAKALLAAYERRAKP